MSEQLKPCPFCGCAMQVKSNRDWHRPVGDHDEGCMLADCDPVRDATDEGLADLLGTWNRRAAPSVSEQPAEEQKCEKCSGSTSAMHGISGAVMCNNCDHVQDEPAAQSDGKDARDAALFQYCIKHGFPVCFQTGWRGCLPNGNLTGAVFDSPVDAIRAAMAQQSKGGEK